jgi:hypothetical protein
MDLMSPKVSGIDITNAVINLEFRLGILEQIVAQLGAVAPIGTITDEVMRDVRASALETIRARYPDAGLYLTAQQISGRAAMHSAEPIFLTLHGNSVSAGKLDLMLQNSGTAFNILALETKTPGCHLLQWYPRSLAEGELLRAPTQLPSGNASQCTYEMKVRDRSGSERTFKIFVDPTTTPTNYDFVEI